MKPQPCIIEGVAYPSIRAAALAIGMSPRGTWARLYPQLNRSRSALWHKRNPERSREKRRHYAGMPEPTRPCPAVCEVCAAPPKTRALALDHDHETGKFRGWLCASCNRGIGLFRDSPDFLVEAANYVRRSRQ